MYPMSSTTPKYRCGFPGCLKRYASTDGVRKHARKTHTQWLRDVDEKSALRDHKLYGNKPSTYCVREVDDEPPPPELCVVAHGQATHAHAAPAILKGAAAALHEELARQYRACLVRSLQQQHQAQQQQAHQQQAHQQQAHQHQAQQQQVPQQQAQHKQQVIANLSSAACVPIPRYAEALPMLQVAPSSLLVALGVGSQQEQPAAIRMEAPQGEQPEAKRPCVVNLSSSPPIVMGGALAEPVQRTLSTTSYTSSQATEYLEPNTPSTVSMPCALDGNISPLHLSAAVAEYNQRASQAHQSHDRDSAFDRQVQSVLACQRASAMDHESDISLAPKCEPLPDSKAEEEIIINASDFEDFIYPTKHDDLPDVYHDALLMQHDDAVQDECAAFLSKIFG